MALMVSPGKNITAVCRIATSMSSHGVNLTFADGHVETRNGKQIQWQQSGNWTTFY